MKKDYCIARIMHHIIACTWDHKGHGNRNRLAPKFEPSEMVSNIFYM